MQSHKEQNRKWNARLRHQDIQIKGTVASRTAQTTKLLTCCLGQWQPDDNNIYEWSIKGTGSTGVHYVGICLSRLAQKTHFQAETTWISIGHGHYVVHWSGYVFSHSDPDANIKRTGFQFACDDTLNLRFDAEKHKLVIQKIDSNDSFEFDVAPATENDQYKPCVYFRYEGTSAELLDQ